MNTSLLNPGNGADITLPTPAAIDHPGSEIDIFQPLKELLEAHFYKPDLQAIRIVLGTIQAHYLNVGDPAWLFVVAPPGTGKSTMSLMGATGLPEIISLGEFSENTFLSGFFGHRDPGILEKLGPTQQTGKTYITTGNGIFLAKDFTTVLSMRREKRSVILGQLREIHDGQYKRAFGTGDTKIWQGRVTIIAAVTPVLARHYSIFAVLGERFLQVRWHRPDSEEAGEWAIRQQGQENQIRKEARQIIGQLFKAAATIPPMLPAEMARRIASLAEVIAMGRTHVYRSSYGNREIEYVPEPEANTRISKGLAAIAKGIAALNRRAVVAEQDLQDAMRVGLDCLSENRRRLLLTALKGQDLASVKMSRTVRNRDIEELAELGILNTESQKTDTDPVEPTLTERVRKLLATARLELEQKAAPECSGGG